jgi:hypothetical protein
VRAHDLNGRHLSTRKHKSVCVLSTKEVRHTPLQSRASRPWERGPPLEAAWSERARVVQCYTHTHTHGEKRSALCVRYLILLVVNIVCVFEWHKTHPLAQWHRKSEKWMHLSAAPSVRTPPDYHLFHAKVSIFVSSCLSRRVI